MLSNYILQTCSAPGTATNCSLIAAPTGRINFSAKFATGATCFYFLDDGTQAEWGIGTLTTGSPDILARTTVIGNTAGTTARLNFAGSTKVFNEIPGESMIYKDAAGVVNAGLVSLVEPSNGIQTLSLTSSSANGISIKLTGNGPTTPAKYLRAINGQFQIANSANSSAILTLSDGGGLAAYGVIQAGVGANGGGYNCKAGALGGFSGNTYNISWNSSAATLWIDNTNLGVISVSSDRRYKRDIIPLGAGALDRLMQLMPVSHGWQNKGIFTDDGKIREGFIAQDVQQIIPSAVNGDETSESPMSLNVMPLIAVTVKSVQELKKTIDDLNVRISALESPTT